MFNLIDLKFFRIKRHLSRKQLASMVKVSENYLYEIETFRKFPSLKLLYRIAEALDIYICVIDLLENNAEDSKKAETKSVEN